MPTHAITGEHKCALRRVCTFMASSTMSFWPASTMSPTCVIETLTVHNSCRHAADRTTRCVHCHSTFSTACTASASVSTLTFVSTSHTLAAIADATSVPPGIAAGPSSAAASGAPLVACLAASRARLASSSSFCDARQNDVMLCSSTHSGLLQGPCVAVQAGASARQGLPGAQGQPRRGSRRSRQVQL